MHSTSDKNDSARLDRRAFTKLALASSLAAGASPASSYAAKRPLEPLSPGMKLSLQVPTDPSDEDLQFAKQLGVGYVNIPSGGKSPRLKTSSAGKSAPKRRDWRSGTLATETCITCPK